MICFTRSLQPLVPHTQYDFPPDQLGSSAALIHFLLSNQGSAESPAIKGRIVLPMINEELTILAAYERELFRFAGLRRLRFEV